MDHLHIRGMNHGSVVRGSQNRVLLQACRVLLCSITFFIFLSHFFVKKAQKGINE